MACQRNRAEILKECREETAEIVRDLKRMGYTVRRSWPADPTVCDFVLENGTTLWPLNSQAGHVLRDLTGFAVYTSDHGDRTHRFNTQGKRYESPFRAA